MDPLLFEILTLKRPAIYAGDEALRSWLAPVLTWFPLRTEVIRDKDGELKALIVDVPGDEQGILFACHLDTVHYSFGKQHIQIIDQVVSLHPSEESECLGADDGAGIWLLLRMMELQVPGTYIFHADEEIGCLGSHWLAREQPEWLAMFKHCISFDRSGTTDVITHFNGVRGCSDKYARHLADNLNSHLKNYTLNPCTFGGSTDVARYLGIIPNVTNVSTGYLFQHSAKETLDMVYLNELLAAAVAIFGNGHHVNFPKLIEIHTMLPSDGTSRIESQCSC